MIHFGPFRFDDVDGTLWSGPRRIPLTRKAADLLVCLLGAEGSWLSKPQILAAVWPDTHVHPDNVKVLVHEIRQALGDDPHAPRFIRSEAGRGYAFIARTVTQSLALHAPLRAPHGSLFICRNAELAVLAEALDAARAGSSRVVLVSGEHGVGKTAFVDAFVRSASVFMPLHAGLGRAIEHVSATVPLHPVANALGNLLQRHPSLAPRLAAPAACRTLGAQTVRGASGTGSTLSDAEVVTMLGAIAADVPLILVLEDLQLADGATLALVSSLAARSQPARWLIVATACTSDAGPDAGGMERLQQSLQASESADVLEMCPFTQHQVARYLDSRFGPGCVTSLAPIVEELTGGNPLMLVAAADGLIEQGFVTADSHGWHRRADGADMREVLIRVLHDPISRQIERLTPLERAIVEAASAVGLEFSVDMVARASGLSPDEVGTLLGRLARRNAIIRPVLDTSRPRLGPGLAFRFRHAAYAEAVAEHAPILQQIFAARRLRRSVSREVSIS